MGGSSPSLLRFAGVLIASVLLMAFAIDSSFVSYFTNITGELNMKNIFTAVIFAFLTPTLTVLSAVTAGLAANGVTPHLFRAPTWRSFFAPPNNSFKPTPLRGAA